MSGFLESDVKPGLLLEASRQGALLWRNNVGVAHTVDNRFIRFGLCNESERVNRVTKSSDFIGLEPVLITGDMVGAFIGRFIALETKRPGWVYKGTKREKAQLNFINLVNSLGGRAMFTTGDFK